MKKSNSFGAQLKGAASYAWREGTVYIILVALIILFSIIGRPFFFTWANFRNILSESSFYIIAGMGIAFVMIGGGIDLSVGYEMAMVATSSFLLIQRMCPDGNFTMGHFLLIIVWGIVLGFVMGLVNGILVTKLKLFPLIVTMATSEVFKGICLTFTQSKSYSGLPELFRKVYTVRDPLLGLPIDVYIAFVIVLITWFVLNKTHFGRDILAVGGNRECARLSGIKADLVQTLTYCITGAVFGLAALDMMAHQNMTSATTGPGTEFTCLTAAIIGGISFMGGKGNVWGLTAGIFVMQIISTGMQLAGMGAYMQYAVKGIILLAAISFDAIKNRPRPVVRIHNDDDKDDDKPQLETAQA